MVSEAQKKDLRAVENQVWEVKDKDNVQLEVELLKDVKRALLLAADLPNRDQRKDAAALVDAVAEAQEAEKAPAALVTVKPLRPRLEGELYSSPSYTYCAIPLPGITVRRL